MCPSVLVVGAFVIAVNVFFLSFSEPSFFGFLRRKNSNEEGEPEIWCSHRQSLLLPSCVGVTTSNIFSLESDFF